MTVGSRRPDILTPDEWALASQALHDVQAAGPPYDEDELRIRFARLFGAEKADELLVYLHEFVGDE